MVIGMALHDVVAKEFLKKNPWLYLDSL